MGKKSLIILLAGLFWVLSTLPSVSFAQGKFPNKPISISIGQGAGGSTDIVARAIAPFLQGELKVPIIIENMPGAGGDVAMNFLWKAKPDGYNIGLLALPANAIRVLTKKPPYKVLETSFIYGLTGGDFNAISVPYNSPIKNFDDLKRLAAEKSLSAGGTVLGSNSWYASILLREAAGIKFKYVPYESGTEAATAAGGGHVDLAITSVVSAVQPAQNKLIRLIAAFGDKRDPDFPDVPTLVDLGYKDAYFSTRLGFSGPPGTPKEIVTTIADAVAKAVQDPKFKEIAKRQGFTVAPLPGPEFYKWAVDINEQARKFLTRAGEIK